MSTGIFYMRKKAKKIAVLNVTARCNSACGFCFGPAHIKISAGRPNLKNEPTTFALLRRIFELHQKGVEMIIFTGGEPLLRQDIWELIEFAKKLSFFTVLHTNGKLLAKKMCESPHSREILRPDKIGTQNDRLQYLDQINLPLDGYDAKTNDTWRGKGHFKAIMAILRRLKDLPIRCIIGREGAKKAKFFLRPNEPIRPVRVIISTVVTKQNAKNVPKIGKILPRWIYKWRVFQFKPMGKARKMRQKFALTDKEFREVSQRVVRSLAPMAIGVRDDRKIKVQCVGVRDKKFWESYTING